MTWHPAFGDEYPRRQYGQDGSRYGQDGSRYGQDGDAAYRTGYSQDYPHTSHDYDVNRGDYDSYYDHHHYGYPRLQSVGDRGWQWSYHDRMHPTTTHPHLSNLGTEYRTSSEEANRIYYEDGQGYRRRSGQSGYTDGTGRYFQAGKSYDPRYFYPYPQLNDYTNSFYGPSDVFTEGYQPTPPERYYLRVNDTTATHMPVHYQNYYQSPQYYSKSYFREANDTYAPFEDQTDGNPRKYATKSPNFWSSGNFANYNSENDTLTQQPNYVIFSPSLNRTNQYHNVSHPHHHMIQERSTFPSAPLSSHSLSSSQFNFKPSENVNYTRRNQINMFSSGLFPHEDRSRGGSSSPELVTIQPWGSSPSGHQSPQTYSSRTGAQISSLDTSSSDVITCNEETQFRCVDGYRCIEKNQRCDSKLDCVDHSDEKDCFQDAIDACKYGLFRCSEKKCIISSFLCE